MKKEKIFYGWIVALACTLIMTTVFGIVTNCASIYIKPVTEDLGFSRGAFSAYFTVVGVSTLFVVPFIGKLCKRFSVKTLLLIGALLSGAGYISYAFASSLAMFYAISILVGIGTGLATMVPVSIIINNWFVEKKGLALGIAMAGSGVGGMLFSNISNQIILRYGWRVSYFVLGIIILVISIPCVLFLIVDTPSLKGLQPYGADKMSKNAEKSTSEGLTFNEIKKTKTFILLMIGLLATTLGGNGMVMHIPSYLTDLGYTPTFSAAVISAMMGILIGGKIVSGIIFDKLGFEKGIAILSVCMCLGTASLLLTENKLMLIILVIGYGIGGCMGAIAPAVLVSGLFGQKSYATTIGVANGACMLGGALGPAITGKMYEVTGGYTFGWIYLVVLTIVMMITLLGSVYVNKKECREMQEAQI